MRRNGGDGGGRLDSGGGKCGIDPWLITPGLPGPTDFDRFWAAKRKLLAKIPIDARLRPIETPERMWRRSTCGLTASVRL